MSVFAGPADWWTDGTDAGRTHIATKGIVQSGLVLNLDAGVSSSYPGSGTTWTDLSGNGNNGTLVNGPTFSSDNGGNIVFDGVDDHITTPLTMGDVISNTNKITATTWFRRTGDFTNFTIRDFVSNITGTTASNSFSMGITNFNGSYIPLIALGGFGIIAPSSLIISLNEYIYYSLSIDYTPNEQKWQVWIVTSNGVWAQRGSATNNIFYDPLNGGIISENNISTANIPSANVITNTFFLGRKDTNYSKIDMASIKIYNRFLEPTEIIKNFNATRGRFGV
jgi:hypothetical protein